MQRYSFHVCWHYPCPNICPRSRRCYLASQYCANEKGAKPNPWRLRCADFVCQHSLSNYTSLRPHSKQEFGGQNFAFVQKDVANERLHLRNTECGFLSDLLHSYSTFHCQWRERKSKNNGERWQPLLPMKGEWGGVSNPPKPLN